MKKSYVLIAALCLLAAPLTGRAQEPVAPEIDRREAVSESDLRARVGFDISKKLTRGLHLTLSEELRMKNSLTSVDRIHSSLGLSYRVNPYFKFGAAYTFIAIDHDGKKSTNYEKYWDLRHRAYLDLLFTYKTGKWRFSFRERPQFTYRTDDDIDLREKERLAITLRHRFKVDYEVHHLPVRPYVSVELSNTLSAPDAVKNYLEKVRSMLGVQWQLSKRSTMEFYYRFDYVFGYDIEVKDGGDRIRIRPEKGFYHILGVFYEYSF